MPTYFYIRLKNSAAAKFRFVEIVFFGFIFETQMKTVPTSFSAAAIFFAAGTKTCFVLFLEHLSKPWTWTWSWRRKLRFRMSPSKLRPPLKQLSNTHFMTKCWSINELFFLLTTYLCRGKTQVLSICYVRNRSFKNCMTMTENTKEFSFYQLLRFIDGVDGGLKLLMKPI